MRNERGSCINLEDNLVPEAFEKRRCSSLISVARSLSYCREYSQSREHNEELVHPPFIVTINKQIAAALLL